jgi:hypothetical protein
MEAQMGTNCNQEVLSMVANYVAKRSALPMTSGYLSSM